MEASIVLSIITAVAAIVALFISVFQIINSNRQKLFERRLNAYLKIKWMKLLCDQNKELLDKYVKMATENNMPLLGLEELFYHMTNTAYLESMQPAIYHIADYEWQRKYLLKVDEIRSLSEEVRLIFPGSIGYDLSDFVFYYGEMIVLIYRYQSMMQKGMNAKDVINKSIPVDELEEMRARMELLKYLEGTFELADRLFKEGTLNKAQSKIKL